jgi:hypothetical protein
MIPISSTSALVDFARVELKIALLLSSHQSSQNRFDSNIVWAKRKAEMTDPIFLTLEASCKIEQVSHFDSGPFFL